MQLDRGLGHIPAKDHVIARIVRFAKTGGSLAHTFIGWESSSRGLLFFM